METPEPGRQMDVACTTEIDEAEYVRFLDRLAARPGAALAYHYPFYLRFLAGVAYPGSTLRFVAARDGRGDLVGVLPGLHVRTERVSLWLSLAYFGPNAGALVSGADGADAAPLIRALSNGAQADARALGCGSLTICTPLDASTDAYRAGLGGIDFVVERIAQAMPISDDPAVPPWPRNVRYDIRRAALRGVTARAVRDEAELDEVWEIYRRHAERAGIPIKPRAHVRELFRTAGRHGIFLVAEHDGAIAAGLVCLVGAGGVSYYLPCTREESRSLQPGLVLLDAAVRKGREAGGRLFNFEASPDADGPVSRFKARCGGRPVPYRVLVKLLRPGVLDEYRTLTAEGVSREAPHAFVVPFSALA